jgi:Holliday junction resolvase
MTNLKRQRGYAWEVKVVNDFKELNFTVTRLGGTTSSMPDVSAHDDYTKTIISIECKSGISDSLLVPRDQLERCIDWCNEWGLYVDKKVILAFKFARKDVNGDARVGKEFLKLWDFSKKVNDVKCYYDGHCTLKSGTKYLPILLEDYKID